MTKAEIVAAIAQKTGARGLRSIMEGILMDTMFNVPSDGSVTKVVVKKECVTEDKQPELIKAKPRPHKNEHLFLNDISGSCEWISSWFFMLMFSAQTAFKHSRTFEFDNKVIETTDALKEEYLIDSFVKVKDLRV